MDRFTVLIIDDERTLARSIKLFLAEQGYEAEVAEDGDRGVELLEKLHPDLVFLDYRLPRTTGLDLLRKIREYDPSISVVMMTAHGTIEGAVEAMKLGAFDYLRKPVDLDELKILVERAQQTARLRQEVRYYREKEARDLESSGLLGRCPALQQTLEQIKHLTLLQDEAPTVLITGETGTGKSVVARTIHSQGSRARFPFIEIDCTALPPTLIESELFGHERGAFTDAKESKVGLIEAADGGTVFLDEVGDIELPVQGKLLRAIEQRTVRRVGSVRDRKVDAWIIAATNKDLEAAMTAGSFRKDLYFRLAVFTIHLPPLRERGDDIALLAEAFLRRFAPKYGKQISGLSRAAVSALRQYPWPGNIRELKHVIERAVLASPGGGDLLDQVPLATLPQTRSAPLPPRAEDPAAGLLASGKSLAEWERSMIEQALKDALGNQVKAARLLGITRDTLRYRMAKYRISP